MFFEEGFKRTFLLGKPKIRYKYIYIYQNAFELKLKTVYFHGLKKKTQELNQKFLRMEKQ